MDNSYMLAQEAFIRRAAQINAPFMLKGSFVSRQYLNKPEIRIPADLDWVYLGTLKNVEDAYKAFNTWATKVTETVIDDGVEFTSFNDNTFWRRIDYAMADDFPTVNTDIACKVDGVDTDFSFDVSFNLDVDLEPVKLLYKPSRGSEFYFYRTAPLAMQVAWKLHQSLVRPRLKDFFDLYFLVQHSDFDGEALESTLQILVNECEADRKDPKRIKHLTEGDWEELFVPTQKTVKGFLGKLFGNKSVKNKSDSEKVLQRVWDYWRNDIKPNNGIMYGEKIKYITSLEIIPTDLKEFKNQFVHLFKIKGFDNVCAKLPQASRNKRKTYND